jgi:hypothetical protein
MATSSFSVTGLKLPEDEDPLGVWAMPEMGMTSFALGQAAEAGEGAETLRWRVDLPASFKAAHPQLRGRLARVERQMARLTVIEARLAEMEPGTAPAAAAFSAQGARSPEEELLAVVDALSPDQAVDPAAAFALGSKISPLQRQLRDQGMAIFDQFRTLVAHVASVETEVEGAGVAVTAVDWTGDFQTAWVQSAKPSAMTLHQAAVRLAVASRLAWLKLMGVVVAGALGLAVKASVPGGQFLLVPAVYKYVRDMLKAFKQVREV